ncbi:MAG: metalloregulator ArsR/SmtB family transcription factor [Lysobacterales bacterium]
MADPTRLRLLALLVGEELTVAELAAATRLAQPRVSTHLAKLKEASLVVDRRAGVSAYYRFPLEELDEAVRSTWEHLVRVADDGLLVEDAERLRQVLTLRARNENWVDQVAGDMERHYSPGRTWDALARALTCMIDAGDVLDIGSGDGLMAELLAPQVRSLTCVDVNPRVVEAARQRLASQSHVTVREGDMHALPLPDGSVDWVLCLQVLPYSEKPATVIAEAARVLRPSGRLLLTTLASHRHQGSITPFGHRNLGQAPDELRQWSSAASLQVRHCGISNQERRPPHFEILSLLAEKGAA